MGQIKTDTSIDRRRLFGVAAATTAVAQLGLTRLAQADTTASFAPLKQISAGLLNVGYAEAGPADGPAVMLLHGWPYDIYSFVDVAPLLASAGYREIENHAHSMALFTTYYNFVRIHKTLRVTPAMAAGVTDRLWEVSDIVALLEATEPKPGKRGPYKKRVAA